uniref:Uncharacterized protein n=1 Tax=Tetranychus urticae TaxID=32264 RepID=T1L048_TETUR
MANVCNNYLATLVQLVFSSHEGRGSRKGIFRAFLFGDGKYLTALWSLLTLAVNGLSYLINRLPLF